jgi:hypothetical protein
VRGRHRRRHREEHKAIVRENVELIEGRISEKGMKYF